MKYTADQLAGVYLKIRNKRAELKRDFEAADNELKEQQDTLEKHMLDMCLETGTDSFKTPSGTIYRTKKDRYWATDWHNFYKFIEEKGSLEMLERRVSQGVIKQWIDENPDDFPPGISVDSRYTINVRKPTKK